MITGSPFVRRPIKFLLATVLAASFLLVVLVPSSQAQEPSLTIGVTADPNPVTVGQPLTFTITASNNVANTVLHGPNITDTLPAGMTFVSATPSRGTCTESGGTVRCDLFPPSLGPGETVTVQIVVIPTVPGTLTNTVIGNFPVLATPVSTTVTVNPPQPLPACSDGLDNDGDGRVDFPADPGCSSASDNDETDLPQPLPACSDGVDNDGDGRIDFPADPGCSSASDGDEADPPGGGGSGGGPGGGPGGGGGPSGGCAGAVAIAGDTVASSVADGDSDCGGAVAIAGGAVAGVGDAAVRGDVVAVAGDTVSGDGALSGGALSGGAVAGGTAASGGAADRAADAQASTAN